MPVVMTTDLQAGRGCRSDQIALVEVLIRAKEHRSARSKRANGIEPTLKILSWPAIRIAAKTQHRTIPPGKIPLVNVGQAAFEERPLDHIHDYPAHVLLYDSRHIFINRLSVADGHEAPRTASVGPEGLETEWQAKNHPHPQRPYLNLNSIAMFWAVQPAETLSFVRHPPSVRLVETFSSP